MHPLNHILQHYYDKLAALRNRKLSRSFGEHHAKKSQRYLHFFVNRYRDKIRETVDICLRISGYLFEHLKFNVRAFLDRTTMQLAATRNSLFIGGRYNSFSGITTYTTPAKKSIR